MLKNKSYLILLIAFGCYFGIFNAISIILSYLIKPFFSGDSLPLAVAAVGGSPVISGIIGVMVLGPLQRKQGVFKKWIVICMCGNSYVYCRLSRRCDSVLSLAHDREFSTRKLNLGHQFILPHSTCANHALARMRACFSRRRGLCGRTSICCWQFWRLHSRVIYDNDC